MIAYIINGKSFGNCVDYVTRRTLEEKLSAEVAQKQRADEKKYESNNGEGIVDHLSKDWELIGASSDIRLYEGRKAMTEDIARPTKTRKPIKDPVGHISLDFHPKDKPRMTDELMAEIALDYLRQMGLTNTPFIVVRHYDKEHPHCHVVFSRVDYNGKILTQTTNFKKNERVCKALNKKYQLNMSTDKRNTKTENLRGRVKTRYEIFNICQETFATVTVIDWADFVSALKKKGVTVEHKYSSTEPSKIIGTFYVKDGKKFPSSKIDKRYTYSGFVAALKRAVPIKAKYRGEKSVGNQVKNPQTTYVSQKQTTPIVIPPLPKDYMGARISEHDSEAYRNGQVICAYICNPDDIVGKHHWIWYDFTTCQPRCELTPPPADRYVPESFKQHSSAPQVSSTLQSQGVGITLSSSSFRGRVQDDQGVGVGGNGISDDFKLWLSRHPGLSIDEALHRYRDEQKAKQRRKGPKLH
ncbi:hypothetical protein E5360_06615 [Muribaculum intestinale]|uniref:relaxase/mobilization nuclease domain-containing protein n=2 Tax=Muribaculaceae TaxID=2005473 RepID=UPI001093F48B|nr:relaxase/mobilization nuclease domain-containing protein [Muribaculum intestinale]TGX84439.1 hypothetical protein E5360_06615 [Muribaculum intestinale]